ncbi:MAG: MerR family transcriptional regulator [Acidimicrobiia bacterium]
MAISHEPDHQSIGEVLATLRDEFPDITISKIRFLESQGLIDPERTPSGYRKFRDNDVARLSWILAQQKENFLPLKVIKARLDAAGPDALPPDIEPTAIESADAESAAGAADAAKSKRTRAAKPRPTSGTSDPSRATPKPRAAAGPRTAKAAAAKTGKAATAPTPALFETQMLPLDDGTDDDIGIDASGASLTRAELAKAAGLTDAALADLEEYGMLAPAAGSGDRVVFDEQALVIARLAAEFAAHGIGPRHLRMFRVFAEREAGLYDQVIAPRLRRRNPEARAQARDDLVDLARLGRAMRAAYLRSATAGMLND